MFRTTSSLILGVKDEGLGILARLTPLDEYAITTSELGGWKTRETGYPKVKNTEAGTAVASRMNPITMRASSAPIIRG